MGMMMSSVNLLRADDVPQIIPLDGEWDLAYKPQMDGKDAPVLPPADWYQVKMPVPGYIDDHLDQFFKTSLYWNTAVFNLHWLHTVDANRLDYPPAKELSQLSGFFFYKKSLRIPAPAQDRMVTLHIGAARIDTWVWLNGQCLGHFLGGQAAPIAVPLDTGFKYDQENEVVIGVSNAYSKRFGCDSRGQGHEAGIPRSVYLKLAGRARIADQFIYPSQDLRKLSWNVELAGKPTAATLEYLIRRPSDGVVLGNGTVPVRDAKVQWDSETFGMEPWSDHTPNLYDVQLTLKAEGQTLDRVNQTFGLRRLERDGIALRLNGRLVMLRGVLDHYGYSVTVHPPSDVESYRNIIRRVQSLGFNYIRFHTHVPCAEYLQAASELGMMIQVEPYGHITDEEWLNIVRHCRKYPSVVIYCGGNEEIVDDKRIEGLRIWARMLHEQAPGTLFSPMSGLVGVTYSLDRVGGLKLFGDSLASEPLHYSPARLKALAEFSDVFEPFFWAHLSYTSFRGNWRVLNERLPIFERPCFEHEIDTKGNYINLDLENRYEGFPGKPYEYTVTREKLKKAGLLHKAPIYYRNSCYWLAMARKHCMEMARKSKYINGYDYHTLTDINWNQSGLITGILDEFYDIKPGESAEEIRYYNGESVLLLDDTSGGPVGANSDWASALVVSGNNDRNLTAGEAFEHDVMASLYGSKPLAKGEVSWYIADDRQNILQRGSFEVKDILNGTVTALGPVKFIVPEVAHPVKVDLHVRLASDNYQLYNRWKYWFFPKQEAPGIEAGADAAVLSKYANRYKGLKPLAQAQGNLRIVSDLSSDTIDFCNQGGRVILLGSKPFPTVRASWQISWTGLDNLATVISDHVLLRDFPHEGYLDWQFYTMYEGQTVRFIGDLEPLFDPIIEVASGYKNVVKQSSLFELGIGKGKLLVCALSLNLDDSAAIYLLDRMLVYGQGDAFQPHQATDKETLLKALNIKVKPESEQPIGGGGQGRDPNVDLYNRK